MKTPGSNRFALWLLVIGLGALGYVLSTMSANVAVPVVGQAMKGKGNLLVRADADASISAVLVDEGQHVGKGVDLFSLNDAEVMAELEALEQDVKGANAVLRAKLAVLSTLEQEYRAVSALARIPQGADVDLDNPLVRGERSSLAQEISGARAVLKSKQSQLRVLSQEFEAVKELVDRGLEPAGELRKAEIALNVNRTELADQQARIELLQARLRGVEPAAELRKAELAVNTLRSEVVEIEVKIASLQAQIRRNEARAKRFKVQAPEPGTVLKLLKHNAGDVVKAGEALAEIVPDAGEVVFEAKVSPMDIGSVKLGNEALIALSSLNRYEVTPFLGRVVYLSPASLMDPEGQPFFIARIRPLDQAALPKDVIAAIGSGQTAEISIMSQDRSVLAFLLAPLMRGASRVFTER